MTVEDNDEVGGLLRTAGRRAAPPETVTAAVYEHAQRAWQTAVSRRRWVRRSYALAASVALMAILARAVMLQVPGMAVGVVDGGAYTLATSSYWHLFAASRSAYLFSGDSLQTASTAVLVRSFSGAELHLDRHSRLTLSSPESVRLLQGRLFVHTYGPGSATRLRVLTDFGNVEHIGTEFLVSKDAQALMVAVRSGRVALHPTSREPVELQSGQAANIDSSGHVERRDLAAFDGIWDWVDTLASPLDIDGQSLYAVVSEIGQRAGLAIRFSDPASEAEARQLLLHGRALNLPPRAALDAVLATTSLDGAVDGPQIVIARRPAQ